MKKFTLLLSIALVNLFVARAQVLTFSPVTSQVNMEVTDISSDAISMLNNSSAVSRTIKWVRYEDSYPAGWTTTVCDTNNCYSAPTSSKQFTIPANKKASIKLNIFPAGIAGSGSYHIIAFDIADSANTVATMYVNVNVEDPNGISPVTNDVISIYPNPVKDVLNLNLNSSKHITSVDIHNIVGQKIKSVNIQDGVKSVNVPVADLKKGIYFVRVYSNGVEVTTKTFSKD